MKIEKANIDGVEVNYYKISLQEIVDNFTKGQNSPYIADIQKIERINNNGFAAGYYKHFIYFELFANATVVRWGDKLQIQSAFNPSLDQFKEIIRKVFEKC